MPSIDELSWNRVTFKDKFALFLTARRACRDGLQSDDPTVRAAAYSSLSSTYYSIAATAFAQLWLALQRQWLAPARIVLWCLTWLPLGLWCYGRMLPLSNRVVQLIGYDDMSPDQCDIRQSILRRRGEYTEAHTCIQKALAKQPEKAHTRGLLHVGLAYLHLRTENKDRVRQEVYEALTEGLAAEQEDPRQAARIYRHCADLADSLCPHDPSQGNRLRNAARQLAEATASNDQRLKLGVKPS